MSVGSPAEGAPRLGPFQGELPSPWNDEDGLQHEDFHAKVSNITTEPVAMREPFASTVQSGIPRPKKDTCEDARDKTGQRSDGEKIGTGTWAIQREPSKPPSCNGILRKTPMGAN